MYKSRCTLRGCILSLLTAFAHGGGFVGVPVATVVPSDGSRVTGLTIRPRINTTETSSVKGYAGSSLSPADFGKGWVLSEGSAAQKGSAGSPQEATSFLDRNLIHIGPSLNSTSTLPLNGQLRGKGGIKAVKKAAPSPEIVRLLTLNAQKLLCAHRSSLPAIQTFL